jgi:signal transduction histidine kinase
LHAADVRGLLPRLDTFARRLARLADRPRPVLVVRLPELERVAWRRGLRAARAVERAATAAFSTAVSRVLRAGDLVAHDGGSDVFVAALVAPTRDGSVPAPVDARSALARIAATMEAATRLEVRTGWTTYEGTDTGAIEALVERALVRGVQERERYAFFSSLGHELRTPLSSIRGYLETLLDDGVDAGTRERFVRIAYNESLRLSRLVEGMFEISLLDLHAAIPVPSSGWLAHALDAAKDACAAGAAARGVSIVFDDAPDVRVAIDADRLTLVLVNLLDNAVKHGRPGGGVFVGVRVDDHRFVRLTVDDDGPGIAAADRERVFAFGDRGATEADGSGIGLALVRLMIERAGGRIDLESSALGGARFTLTIPRASGSCVALGR